VILDGDSVTCAQMEPGLSGGSQSSPPANSENRLEAFCLSCNMDYLKIVTQFEGSSMESAAKFGDWE